MKVYLKAFVVAVVLSYGTLSWGAAESWYTYWGLGVGSVGYDSDTKTGAVDVVEAAGYKHSTTAVGDAFGFYWPAVTPTTLMGFVGHAIIDTWKFSGLVDATFSISMTQLSFSTMHFFGAEPGDGLFLRGDAGVTRLTVRTSAGALSYGASSDNGFGIVLGGGYGLPVTDGFRVLFSLTHAMQKAEDITMNTTAFTVGGLW